MARRFRPLTRAASALRAALLAALLPASRALAAEDAPTPSPPPPAPGVAAASPSAKPKPSVPDDWAEATRLFEQLAPDQKKKFLDNLDQWKAMSPEEQELFRNREQVRREKIAAEIEDAVNKSGLHLDDDQREVYALRYTQERRKIEEILRKEMDQKRKLMVAAMLDRLKVEFSSTPAPVTIPSDNPTTTINK